MPPKKYSLFLASLSIIICALIIIIVSKKYSPSQNTFNTTPSLPSSSTELTFNPLTSEQSVINLSIENLNNIAQKIQEIHSEETNYKILLELEKLLHSLSPEDATLIITQYLNLGYDASTKLFFNLNSNGFLEMAPTFRTFLMDQLADINPSAAAQLSKIILESSSSPDEWAISFRNYVWGQPNLNIQSDTFFIEKLNSLLSNSTWLKNPTAGFLQAFDAALYSNQPHFVSTLSNIYINSSIPESTQYAAHLALIRFSENNFPKTAHSLLSFPITPPSTTEIDSLKLQSLRAEIFTHADLSQDHDYSIIQNYLFNPNISTTEKSEFLENFPNIIDIHSNNLLTKQLPKSLHNNKISDERALQLFQKLYQDTEFDPLKPSLLVAIKKLENYLSLTPYHLSKESSSVK